MTKTMGIKVSDYEDAVRHQISTNEDIRRNLQTKFTKLMKAMQPAQQASLKNVSDIDKRASRKA